MIINLLSCPRNLSTALMYSFAQRDQCMVIDEPFYGYYLHQTKKQHPGYKAVLQEQATDYRTVLDEIENIISNEVFVKNMCHHIIDIPLTALSDWKHIIYIRHPARIIHSYTKVIQEIDATDIGIEWQYKVVQELLRQEQEFVILNSEQLTENPEDTLAHLCEGIDIPYANKMLQWPKGAREFDGSWAPYWYKNVHQSTSFLQQNSIPEVKPKYRDIYERAMLCYQEIIS